VHGVLNISEYMKIYGASISFPSTDGRMLEVVQRRHFKQFPQDFVILKKNPNFKPATGAA